MVVFRARIMPLLAALLVALPLGASGSVQYFCRGMGKLMLTCCCPSDSAGAIAEEHGGPRLESRTCCDRLSCAPTTAVPALRDKASFPSAMAALAVARTSAIGVSREPRVIAAEAVVAGKPPPRGLPIFLANCALLI